MLSMKDNGLSLTAKKLFLNRDNAIVDLSKYK